MDLLDSILNDMDKQGPPRINQKEKMLRKQMKQEQEKQKLLERKHLENFRQKMETIVDEFMQNSTSICEILKPMEKVHRMIVHEVAEVAGLPAYSFGVEGIDRHVQIFKRETAPSEKELEEMRHSQIWDLGFVRQQIIQKQKEQEAEIPVKMTEPASFKPTSDYKEKYEHLIGKEAAKDAAKRTVTNKQYGFVPSENKKDQRSIEQTLADLRAKKRQKLSHEKEETGESSSQPQCGPAGSN